jgi:hypothetical protein
MPLFRQLQMTPSKINELFSPSACQPVCSVPEAMAGGAATRGVDWEDAFRPEAIVDVVTPFEDTH